MSSRWESSAAFCPVHWPDHEQCDRACSETRQEFRRSSDALRMYWRDVARGDKCAWCGRVVRIGAHLCNRCHRQALAQAYASLRRGKVA